MADYCDICKYRELNPRDLPCRDCVTIDGFPSKYTEEDPIVEGSIPTNPNVDHPSHYQSENGMECIDEMALAFGVEAVKHFCLCNVWKYRFRANKKNGDEDIEKSNWYMKKYKELCGR